MTPQVADQIREQLGQMDHSDFEIMYDQLFPGSTDRNGSDQGTAEQIATIVYDVGQEAFDLKMFKVDWETNVWMEEPPVEFSTGHWWDLGTVDRVDIDDEQVAVIIKKSVAQYRQEAEGIDQKK